MSWNPFIRFALQPFNKMSAQTRSYSHSASHQCPADHMLMIASIAHILRWCHIHMFTNCESTRNRPTSGAELPTLHLPHNCCPLLQSKPAHHTPDKLHHCTTNVYHAQTVLILLPRSDVASQHVHFVCTLGTFDQTRFNLIRHIVTTLFS